MNNKPNAKAIMPDADICDNAPSEFSHYVTEANEYTSVAGGVRLLDDMRQINALEIENTAIFQLLDSHQNDKLQLEAENKQLRERVVSVEYALALTRPILRSFISVTIPAVSKTLNLIDTTLNNEGE